MKIKPTGAFRGPGSARRSAGFRMAGPSSPVEASHDSVYRNDKSWQEAMTLAEDIFRWTDTWKGANRVSFASVLRDSASSIPGTVAYAHTLLLRNAQQELFQRACAELARLETLLHLAERLGYCPHDENEARLKKARETAALLNRQIQLLEMQRAVTLEEGR